MGTCTCCNTSPATHAINACKRIRVGGDLAVSDAEFEKYRKKVLEGLDGTQGRHPSPERGSVGHHAPV